MSERKKIKEEADALIEKVVKRIINDKFDFFKSVIMTIEMMLAFEAI
jgi:hypothetical protein